MAENKNSWYTRKRIIHAGAMYHVTQRSTDGNLYFKTEKDKNLFLRLMFFIFRKLSVEIYAYCLMDNHVHILIRTQKPNISEAAKALFETYSFYFNRRHNRKGALVQGRFGAGYVSDESMLLPIAIYIHNNPVKAYMVSKAEEYEWSSAQYYSGIKHHTLILRNKMLEILKSSNVTSTNLLTVAESFKYKDEKSYRDIQSNIKNIAESIGLLDKTEKLSADMSLSPYLLLKQREDAILELYNKGVSQTKIAQKCGMSQGRISQIIKNSQKT